MGHQFPVARRLPGQMDPQPTNEEEKMADSKNSEGDAVRGEIESLRADLASSPKDPIVIPSLDIIGRSHPLHPDFEPTAVSLTNDRRLTK